MSTIQTLKEVLFGTVDTEQYNYQCEVCHAEFTSEEQSVQTVACPECGSHNIRERL
ncbi:hypothetical protein [Haloferax profundi]|uniref:hypothetical protein n=1 Tax=Haloferax profundi TaxID=1544718 RepID=UPI000A4939D0|nr:hypothetical protein [Haloferax profundi]